MQYLATLLLIHHWLSRCEIKSYLTASCFLWVLGRRVVEAVIRCRANIPFCVWNFLSSFLILQGKSQGLLKYLSAFAVCTTPLAFDYTVFCIVFKCVYIVSSMIMWAFQREGMRITPLPPFHRVPRRLSCLSSQAASGESGDTPGIHHSHMGPRCKGKPRLGSWAPGGAR